MGTCTPQSFQAGSTPSTHRQARMSNFDTSIDPTRSKSLDDIAAWVKKVGDGAESHALEAKSSLTFTNKTERNKSFAKIIKFIIGASNRDEFTAAKLFNGYGVMVIGVGQGTVHGVQDAPEQHEFDDYARKYFGPDTPTYEFRTHEFEGRNLLFVLVDPPVNGKAIYICSRDYYPNDRADSLSDGAVFYRNSTQTKPADSGQLRDIISRLLGGNSSVKLDISPNISNYCLTNEMFKEFFAEHAARITQEAHEKEQESSESSWPIPKPIISSSLRDPGSQVRAELKAAQNYESRIEECIQKVLELTLPHTVFSVTNTGTTPLKDPTIEFTVPTKVRVIRLEDSRDLALKDILPNVIPFVPAPPKPLHGFPTPDFLSELKFSFSISDNPARNNVLIWKPGSINPGSTIDSHDQPINILLEHTEKNITITWCITDSNLTRPLTGNINQETVTVKDLHNLYEQALKRKPGEEEPKEKGMRTSH